MYRKPRVQSTSAAGSWRSMGWFGPGKSKTDGGRCVRIGDETTAVSPVAPAASPPLADDDVTASTPKEVVLDDALTWPRATSRQFGCMLERAGHKDPSFHCGARKPASGDPCKAPEAYSRGPEFPGALAARAVKGAEKIQLGWEHGDLQAVEVDFAPGVDDAAIRKAFGLPGSKQAHPNVMDADVQRCSKDRWCLVLQGFDHMGAGDVDCDEDENPE